MLTKNKILFWAMEYLKTIVVDDEPRARNVLTKLLDHKDYQNLKVVAETHSVLGAVEKIKELKPDLIFLDVQMPKYAGYEIVDFFEEIDFEIIFVTAYDKYAIQAFEVCAIDYLVKPISRERLKQAVKKASLKLDNKKKIEQYELLSKSFKEGSFEKLIVPELNNRRIIDLKDIIAVQANGSYTILHLRDSINITTSKNLKYYEDSFSLCSYLFRSHRSWIVNINDVKRINRTKGFLELPESISARISRSHYDNFEKLIEYS